MVFDMSDGLNKRLPVRQASGASSCRCIKLPVHQECHDAAERAYKGAFTLEEKDPFLLARSRWRDAKSRSIQLLDEHECEWRWFVRSLSKKSFIRDWARIV